MIFFYVYGVVHEMGVHFCESLVRKIAASVHCKVEVEVMFEIDYIIRLEQLRKKYPGVTYYKLNYLVIHNGEIVGDMNAMINLALNTYNIETAEASNTVIYNRSIRETGFSLINNRGRPVISMEFLDAGSKPSDAIKLGTVLIELFSELCPLACENFRLLVCGVDGTAGKLHYKGCPVHRIVKDGWLQSGDVIDGSGRNSITATGETLPDESFTMDFGFPHGGIVGFANSGPHSSGSQFFITLGPCKWMNHQFVGIGRVIQGYNVVRALNTVPTSNQKPIKNIIIAECRIADDL